MNPSWILYFKSLALALISYPFASLFEKEGYLFVFTMRLNRDLLVESYLWTLYAFFIIIAGYHLLGLGRRVKAYQKKDVRLIPDRTIFRIWAGLFIAAALCTLVLFIQTGFTYPLLSALGKSAKEISLQRTLTGQMFNNSLYGIGLKIFMAFALALALFFVHRLWVTAASIVLFLILATFSLAKSPILDTLILLIVISLFLKRPKWKTVIAVCAILVLIAGFVFSLTGVAGPGDVKKMVTGMSTRVFYGQFADLPFYFDLYSRRRLPFAAMLPPYIQSLLGVSEAPASRKVIEISNPKGIRENTAGVASSIFIGEAYALAGIPGVVIAPFWVLVYFVMLIMILTSLQKSIVNVFLFAYLFDRMTTALFSGMGYFIFSGIQIIIALLIYATVMRALMRKISAFQKPLI